MASKLSLVCIFALSLHAVTSTVLNNCTTNVCDLQTCTDTSSRCRQLCTYTPCKMSCSSPAGCYNECKNGGCSKMLCDVPTTNPSASCLQQCFRDCNDMTCKSKSCYLECFYDNCNMSCHGKGGSSSCQPICRGKGCNIAVHSTTGDAKCEKGSCTVRFSNMTSGKLYCGGGDCTFICAKGKTCEINGACPNCKGPLYVDDPIEANVTNAAVLGKNGTEFVFYAILSIFFMLFALYR